ncbi:adenylate/guanylate cyclase domain-containing protein [Mycobacterium sp. M1]|uniref:Adenylate/guanylate cyclase domain-containing protein n=1 Tax=Mycolicibacter acidiphilus TaxID=2835306 RepID=A0ABS5RMD1_9MYCO|nr:adenylate/guanylate cyclase domain-containing protein [Mycolicibacter acidiphilus]MBS9535349.1 adenylate/guanylate cyclase domain-containing protein [Mycolicibacter acidiphilus]
MADSDRDGLLDGLQGTVRAERAELVDWLLDQGITVDEIRTAPAPMLLASRRLIGDDGGYVSERQISEAAGIDLGLLQQLLRAVGLSWVDDPDAVVHMRADGKVAEHARRFIDAGIDADHAVQTLRVLSDGFSHAAELMRSTMLAAIMEPGLSELQIAQRSQLLVGRMVPMLGAFMEDLLFTQLRHQLETESVNAGERAAGAPLAGARRVTVAFADLVGFTRLGELVPPEELVQLANRLALLARDLAVPPVRFIKTIGDAVMFVCPEPAPLLDATLKLVEAADSDDDFPRLRAGIATGDAVSRVGDWFGSPVNTASRVTGVARPGTVLVADSTYRALTGSTDFRWSFAGARHLKGISGELALYRARRSVDDAPDGA